MSFILNLPYTFFGIIVALILRPCKFNLHRKPFAFIFRVRNDSYGIGYIKGWRGVTIGNVVILNPREEENDLEHELIHVEQNARLPLIFPFFYYYELFRKGYIENKYEKEAYQRAGNIYRDGR